MTNSYQLCIVIPCYNESDNFLLDKYYDFLNNNKNVMICLVNDGSTDSSLEILKKLQKTYPKNIDVISDIINIGKAEAVRKGVNYCNKKYTYKYIAYLDADLAVSLEECQSFVNYFKDDIEFCFGSRILRIGSEIERSKSRQFIGRIVATIISNLLSLKVYDTQCGCKLFTRDLANQLFGVSFISRWLFDVEIFFRILQIYGKEISLTKMLEVPLLKWIDRGDSKVKFTYFFKLWIDLFKIRKAFK